MATKLKNLKVKKVDFVDEGANPDAHIRLFKRRDGGPEPMPEPPAEGQSEPEKNAKLWGRVFGTIAKIFSSSDSMEGAVEEIEKKDAKSFTEAYSGRELSKITDEAWELCFALESSLCSIVMDDDMDSTTKEAAMKASLEEFNGVMEEAVKQWSIGREVKIAVNDEPATAVEVSLMKSAKERLESMIQKAANPPEDNGGGRKDGKLDIKKGDMKEMKIDKSKLTEAEKAFLESIEKRYGEEDPAGTEPQPVPAVPQEGIAKGTDPKPAAPEPAGNPVPAAAGTPDGTEDVWKGVHPAVRAEMEALRKFRQEAEDREINEVAKKYAIIGKKPEELAPVLKSLKAAGGTAYGDMIAVLDSTVEMVEKSGLFGEIGKSGHGESEGGSWAQAEAKAAELMKSRTGITKAQALDEVFRADPELAAKCEEEE